MLLPLLGCRTTFDKQSSERPSLHILSLKPALGVGIVSAAMLWHCMPEGVGTLSCTGLSPLSQTQARVNVIDVVMPAVVDLHVSDAVAVPKHAQCF